MELTIPEFVVAVLATSGFVVAAMSLASRQLHNRAEARSLKNRVICRLCLHAFEDASLQPKGRVIDCPHCGTANEKSR